MTLMSASVSAKTARELWLAQRRAYCQLRHQKCAEFWLDKFTTATRPQDVWSIVERLLGRGRCSCDGASADILSTFFADEVKLLQSATSGSPPPTFHSWAPGVLLTEFTPVSPEDVMIAIARLPDKSSAVDPFSISVLLSVSDLLAPFLAHLFNCSLAAGRFPSCFKDSYVTPALINRV